MLPFRSTIALGVLTGVCLLVCGCEKSERIEKYTVPKHEALQTKKFQADFERRHPKPKQMLGVVIPHENLLWFFKLEGPIEDVTARKNDVREFLKSVRFTAYDKIEWTLPENWQALPGNQMREATLLLDGPAKLEITVTKFLANPEMPISEQVLANINRWRHQLSLPPIEEDDLSARTEKLEIDHTVGYWLDITGRPRPRPAGMPGMPSQGGAPHAMPQQGSPRHDQSGSPVYQKPEGWFEGQGNGVAAVTLNAVDGESKVVITVTAAGGDRLQNVNRWRKQVELPPIDPSQLAEVAKKVDVGSRSGEQFEMTNNGRTILAVIVEDHGQTWFIKLDGNQELAERERPRFKAFLKSLRLS